MDYRMVNQVSALNWQSVLETLCSPMDNNTIYNIFHHVMLNRFVEANHPSSMIQYCLKDDFNRECLKMWMSTNLAKLDSSKSSIKSKAFRTLGNKKFKIGDDVGSLELYSKSVCSAPFQSEEFPLALANRSASLFRLENFKECLQDINLALASGYPSHLRHKLLLRKGKALMTFMKLKEASDVLIEAKKNWPAKERNSTNYKELLEAMEYASESPFQGSKPTGEKKIPLPKLKNGESSNLKFMSAALELKESEEKGRHIIANTDIEIGDILFVEKPYAFVVLPNQYETHGHNCCHNCCADILAPIPCEHCVTAIYCSDACRKAAWEKFHRWECGGLELFYLIGIAHLGLRVTLVSYGEERGERYQMMQSLMSHMKEMDPRDLYQYALTATLLSLFLERKEFFINRETNLFDVGGEILLHICQLTCNGHAITKFLGPPPSRSLGISLAATSIEYQTQERAATAIYPSASMMNHSCEPNIVNSFFNEYLIVKAMKRIPKGSEVFNCYGPHYLRMNKKDRSKNLQEQYFFTCDCPHCLVTCPSSEFLSKFLAFLCPKCEGALVPNEKGSFGKCQHCNHRQPLKKLDRLVSSANALFDEGVSSFEAGEPELAISSLQESLSLYKSSVYKYNRRLAECKDTLSKCYAMISNFSESRKYLMECIPVIEQLFGVDSLEVANEYVKLMTVIFSESEQCQNRKLKKKLEEDCIKYSLKAKDMYDLYFGYWNKEYKDIVDKAELFQKILKLNL